MTEQPTCGRGLAENAALPARLAEVTAAMATVLEQHMTALDPADPRSKAERVVYDELAGAHRRAADQLRASADRMAAQRDLPMGPHDMEALTHPTTVQAFQALADAKRDLLDLLRDTADQDRAMLELMRDGR